MQSGLSSNTLILPNLKYLLTLTITRPFTIIQKFGLHLTYSLARNNNYCLHLQMPSVRVSNTLQNTFHSIIFILQQKKSTPKQMALYKLSLLLYRTLNSTYHGKDWLDVTNQIICTGRQSRFNIHKSCNYKIGNNILPNKFSHIADKLELDLLNLPYCCINI